MSRGFSTYPDHELVGLPALSPTMEVGTIATWKFAEGASFDAGDVVCEVETDKAVVDFEVQDEGVIAKILVDAGSEIKVGAPIMITVSDPSDVAAFKDYKLETSSAPEPTAPSPAPDATPAPAATPAPIQAPTPVVSPSTGDRVFASPLARKLAKEAGYEISGIPGTGPIGRIIAADVVGFTPAAAPAVEEVAGVAAPAEVAPVQGIGYVDYPISDQAREIAARLTKSKQEVPHYYLSVEIELDSLLALRKELNAAVGDDSVTLNDLLVKAAALAMKATPGVNASWLGSSVRVYDRCDVNVVAGVGDGLVAPVVKDVGALGLKALSDDIRAKVESAESGTLRPEDCAIGTFSIVNLGMYGVKSASPIVTEPQAAVLALGAAAERVLPNEDPDAEEIYRMATMLTATCSFDHRVVDGAVGAQWLAAYKQLVENPVTMLL